MLETYGLKNNLEIDSFQLKLIAIISMLIDHTFILFPNTIYIRIIGRLALPIFCFLIVEGFSHTKNPKKYALRLLLFAIISQIPFNLCIHKTIDFQGLNILFTLFLSLIVIWVMDLLKNNISQFSLGAVVSVLLCQYILFKFKADGSNVALYMILTFYLFKNDFLKQAFLLFVINTFFINSNYPFYWNNQMFLVPIQSFATLAILPIMLYKGKKGISNKFIQYSFYSFYPVHLLILWLIYLWKFQ